MLNSRSRHIWYPQGRIRGRQASWERDSYRDGCVLHVRWRVRKAYRRKDLLRSGERSGADARKTKVDCRGVAPFSFANEAVARKPSEQRCARLPNSLQSCRAACSRELPSTSVSLNIPQGRKCGVEIAATGFPPSYSRATEPVRFYRQHRDQPTVWPSLIM